MKTTIDLISMMTLLLAAVIAMAGPGAQLDWWHFSTGLKMIRELSLPMILFAGASAVGLVISLFTARSIVAAPLIATIFGALAAFTPIKMKQLVAENPFIHDITTDFENPPPILAAADEERSNP
ncbi:MAG: hypothetical protein HKP25_07590, partial [Marinicaulis sp.]|nr:hypothetical protein [Marinicaulis sp.]